MVFMAMSSSSMFLPNLRPQSRTLKRFSPPLIFNCASCKRGSVITFVASLADWFIIVKHLNHVFFSISAGYLLPFHISAPLALCFQEENHSGCVTVKRLVVQSRLDIINHLFAFVC